jgi:hypothetical protein
VLNAVDLHMGHTSSSYGNVITVDKKLRALPLPTKFILAANPCQVADPQQYPQPQVRRHEHLIYTLSGYSQLVLHQPSFVKALFAPSDSQQQRPTDPLKGQYSRSVTAVYENSQRILYQYHWLMNNETQTLEALYPCHIHAFAIESLVGTYLMKEMYMLIYIQMLLGVLIIRAPQSPLSSQAMVQFDEGCLFLLRNVSGRPHIPKGLVSTSSLYSYRSLTCGVPVFSHPSVIHNGTRNYGSKLGTKVRSFEGNIMATTSCLWLKRRRGCD